MFLSRTKMTATSAFANTGAHNDLQAIICRPRSPGMAKALQWHVGDVVRKLREDREWSQSQLAKRAGIGRQAVAKVEKNDGGQRRGNLERVAKALGFIEPELYAMVPRRTVIEPRDTGAPEHKKESSDEIAVKKRARSG
jgi:transcriptional regulator with XRE-family HTH domain